jgi:catechol 2,3-dioxygenase-like lactoylglutathione lyase family enzyme
MMRLRTTLIFVADLPRLLAFYRDGLGLIPRLETATDRFIELDAGGCRLALHAIPAEILATLGDLTTPPQPREDTPIKLIFETDDLAQARSHLAACGATMDEPSAWGSCDGLDPEGNVFQITT